MLQAPTGFGKTIVSAAIIGSARNMGKRATMTVPRIGLIDQTLARFESNGLKDIGVLQADHLRTNGDLPIQIASIQTLVTRDKIPNTDLGLIDEAHIRYKWIQKWFTDADYPIIGLSATPWSRGLGDDYDDLIIPVTLRELIDDGFLVPFTVYAPTHPDLRGVRTGGSKNDPDYNEDQLAEIMSEGKIVADVLQTWLLRGEGRPTIGFAVNRAHAKCMQEAFEREGIPTGYIDCETPRDERTKLEQDFHSGEIKVVWNVDVLGVGTDWDVRCLILARPTKSIIRHVQTFGRGLRIAEGKENLICLDHGDSHLRLGYVTDIDIQKMHKRRVVDGQPEDDGSSMHTPPKPVECRRCHVLMPARTTSCPGCGFKRMLQPAEVDVVKGELGLFNGQTINIPSKNNRDFTWEEKASWRGQILWAAQARGRSEGWAAHRYKEKFGVWPNDPRVKYARPRVATQDVLRWLKSRDIAYSKGKKKRELVS